MIDTRALAGMSDVEEKPCPPVAHGFRLVLSEAVFDRMVARGGDDTSREVGGILVGQVYRDAAGPWVHVTTTIDALHAEEKGHELTLTHDTWSYIHDEMDSNHDDQRIVGWYHTHPGFGVFLSEQDTFIHRSFFDMPFQVALVYDPISREHGAFSWQADVPTRLGRYWVGDTEQTWQPRKARTRTSELPKVEAAAPSSPMSTRPAPRSWVLLALLLISTVAGFAGYRLGQHHTNEQLKIDVSHIQAEAHEHAAQQLQGDLMHVLLGEALAEAEVAVRALEEAGGGAGLAEMKALRDRLARLAVRKASVPPEIRPVPRANGP